MCCVDDVLVSVNPEISIVRYTDISIVNYFPEFLVVSKYFDNIS